MTETLNAEIEDINTVTSSKFRRQVFSTLEVEGLSARFQLDTGAMCNVIRKCDIPVHTIQPTNQTLSMYSRDTITPLENVG